MATLDDGVLVQTVAVTASGAWLVLWTQPAGADQVGVGGALFDAQDHLQRLFFIADPLPDPGGRVISSTPHAAALSGGGFAVAWRRPRRRSASTKGRSPPRAASAPGWR